MTERKTWVIPADKWHARIYRDWQSVAEFKNTSGYRENLCHYWRVVVFWAPVTIFCKWFFFNETPKNPYSNDEIPPFLYLVVLGTPVVLTAMAYATMPWWEATAWVLGVPLFIIVCLGALYLWDKRKKKRKRARREALRNGEIDPFDDDNDRNLLFEVLRAKKHKICPLIEIENGDAR